MIPYSNLFILDLYVKEKMSHDMFEMHNKDLDMLY